MDWSSLIGPAVVAAVIAGLVSVIGFLINRSTVRSMHVERLTFERDLAERKFAFDKQLAEHRARLDADLAERKFAFDRALAIWRRRFDIAEQVLAATYEVRDALNWARGRGVFSGEGKTRVATEPESEAIKEARDSAFVPIERLQSHSKAFATLQTLQDSIVAHFGHEAAKPISEIFAVRHGITGAAASLIRYAEWNENQSARHSLQPFRDELWGEKGEQATSKLTAAVQQLEALLRPILSVSAPA